MCGPSNTQKSLEASQQQFMNELQGNYAQNFQEQQAVLNHLNGVLAPILQAGPNQTGFSPAEKAALDTQAIDSTAAGAAATNRAIANETSGRNDSGNNPQSGVDQALEANAESSEEGTLSQEELGITQADYATGRSNFNNAVAGEEATAGGFSPNAAGSLAVTANQSAFGEASQINQEQNQEEADIAGGVTSLAEGGLSGFENLDSTGGSSGQEQLQNFIAGF